MIHQYIHEPWESQNRGHIDFRSPLICDISYSETDSIYDPIIIKKGSISKERKELIIHIDSLKKSSRNIPFEDILIDELSKHFASLTKNFEDLRIRQIHFSKIKKDISNLWSIKQEEGFYGELLLFLNQAIENLHSENLDGEKVEAFEDAISRLKRGGITEEDIETLVDEFLDSGITIVPQIPELSKLYDD